MSSVPEFKPGCPAHPNTSAYKVGEHGIGLNFGPHEPLYDEGGEPVRPWSGRLGYPQLTRAHWGTWDDGQLHLRICKHCGVFYAQAVKDIDQVEVDTRD